MAYRDFILARAKESWQDVNLWQGELLQPETFEQSSPFSTCCIFPL